MGWNKNNMKTVVSHSLVCGMPEVQLLSNRTTTREWGDIPGIAKPYDIFVSIPLEDMRVETGKRADEYIRVLNSLGHNRAAFKNHPIHSTDVALSPIQNPSARVRNRWDWDYQGTR